MGETKNEFLDEKVDLSQPNNIIDEITKYEKEIKSSQSKYKPLYPTKSAKNSVCFVHKLKENDSFNQDNYCSKQRIKQKNVNNFKINQSID